MSFNSRLRIEGRGEGEASSNISNEMRLVIFVFNFSRKFDATDAGQRQPGVYKVDPKRAKGNLCKVGPPQLQRAGRT
jgi:hypothetical protein